MLQGCLSVYQALTCCSKSSIASKSSSRTDRKVVRQVIHQSAVCICCACQAQFVRNTANTLAASAGKALCCLLSAAAAAQMTFGKHNLLSHPTPSDAWRLVRKSVSPAFAMRNIKCVLASASFPLLLALTLLNRRLSFAFLAEALSNIMHG